MNNRHPGLILLLATLVTTLLILALGYLPVADTLRATAAAGEGHAEMQPQGLLRLLGLVKPIFLTAVAGGLTLLVLNGWNGLVRKKSR